MISNRREMFWKKSSELLFDLHLDSVYQDEGVFPKAPVNGSSGAGRQEIRRGSQTAQRDLHYQPALGRESGDEALRSGAVINARGCTRSPVEEKLDGKYTSTRQVSSIICILCMRKARLLLAGRRDWWWFS